MIFETLTNREKEVLELIVAGLDAEKIAKRLVLSKGRVCAITAQLYDKYNISDSPQRVKLVLERLKELGIIGK